jgi:hypothetical protein
MRNPEFVASSFADAFVIENSDFEEVYHPAKLFSAINSAIENRDIQYVRIPVPDNERAGEADEIHERAAKVSMNYQNDNQFEFKGRSYAIFEYFIQSLISWAYCGSADGGYHDEVSALRRLLRHADEIVSEVPNKFFDTDFIFTISGADKDNDGTNRLEVTIGIDVEDQPYERYLPFRHWSESVSIYMV